MTTINVCCYFLNSKPCPSDECASFRMLIIICLETNCQDVSLLFCSFFQAGASLAACPKPFARVVLLFTYFFPSFDSVSLLLLLLVHTPTCRCGLPGSLGLHRQGRQVLGMLNPSFSLNGGDLWGFPSGGEWSREK